MDKSVTNVTFSNDGSQFILCTTDGYTIYSSWPPVILCRGGKGIDISVARTHQTSVLLGIVGSSNSMCLTKQTLLIWNAEEDRQIHAFAYPFQVIDFAFTNNQLVVLCQDFIEVRQLPEFNLLLRKAISSLKSPEAIGTDNASSTLFGKSCLLTDFEHNLVGFCGIVADPGKNIQEIRPPPLHPDQKEIPFTLLTRSDPEKSTSMRQSNSQSPAIQIVESIFTLAMKDTDFFSLIPSCQMFAFGFEDEKPAFVSFSSIKKTVVWNDLPKRPIYNILTDPTHTHFLMVSSDKLFKCYSPNLAADSSLPTSEPLEIPKELKDEFGKKSKVAWNPVLLHNASRVVVVSQTGQFFLLEMKSKVIRTVFQVQLKDLPGAHISSNSSLFTISTETPSLSST
ncbi:hypothetical protein BLNAU_8774 [Blattamonas nauphoetae]|uniref:Uncharacterized protein n=1 Tax=Blattamonas nauphoetae TaxID=2049346 RepID=A0ABQ9XXM0_9EUKA|nr:hypothetical protein BLNAU_8774 [Blattamonas nauphoetae]